MSGESFRSSTSHSVVSKGSNLGAVSPTPLSAAYTLGGDTCYDVRRGGWTYGPIGMLQYNQLHADPINLSGTVKANIWRVFTRDKADIFSTLFLLTFP